MISEFGCAALQIIVTDLVVVKLHHPACDIDPVCAVPAGIKSFHAVVCMNGAVNVHRVFENDIPDFPRECAVAIFGICDICRLFRFRGCFFRAFRS